MPPRTLDCRRVVSAWRRLLREEEGVALVLTIVSMLVLTITLTAVIFLTAAGARDAQRTNAGQRAYAIPESGINNALAILNAAYPDTTHAYPGDKCLLRPQTIPAGFPGTAVFSSELSAPPTGCGPTAKFSFAPDASHPTEIASYWGSL